MARVSAAGWGPGGRRAGMIGLAVNTVNLARPVRDDRDLFSVYSVLSGLTVVLLFAYQGATYVTICTVGDLCEPAARSARSLATAVALVGRVFLACAGHISVNTKKGAR